MNRIKFITGVGGARSCAVVRGAVPARLINASQHWHVEVKDENSFYPYDVSDCDIIVLQRAWSDRLLPYLRSARRRGVKIVFDIDDAIWLLPDDTDKKESTRFGLSCSEQVRKGLAEFVSNEADAVICSTPELADALLSLCRPRRVHVVNNFVDHEYFFPTSVEREPGDRKVILWYAANGHNFSASFLKEVAEAVLDQRDDVEFQLAGCTNLFSELKPLYNYGNRVQTLPWVDYFTLGSVISCANIVLCPVLDHPFTRCKSEIKAVEAAACGVPAIMSDVPQYRRFASRTLLPDDQTRFVLSPDVGKWVEAINMLLDGKKDMSYITKYVNMNYGAIRCVETWTQCYSRILAM
jgi:glycosyltransferase involved in cell wall biosynthesis